MSRNAVFCVLLLCVVILGSQADHEHRATKRTSASSSTNPSGRQGSVEFSSEFWRNQAQAKLKSKLLRERAPVANGKPKNIILFLADGLSFATSAAARVHAGGNENFDLAFDKFPSMGISKTYCVDRQVPDSSSTATAFLTGVKTNYGLVGMDAIVRRYNCTDHANKDYHTKASIAEMAMDAGKSAGFVTTVRVTHATPAPLYAHSANRYWESDDEMEKDCDPADLEDIAEQLVFGETGKKLKVVLGGGRNRFLPNTTRDEEGALGVRRDNKNLINDWLLVHGEGSEYVWNRHQLMDIDIGKTDYLLGLFEENYMKYDYQAKTDPLEPSLSDMTEVAIKMLQKEEKGFFLLVEGGRVDTAHHSAYAKAAVDETRAFSDAIDVALWMTSSEDTLIVVTADHSHTMTYNGYPARGSDVSGIAEMADGDGLPFSTLSYANGPGFANMYGSVYGERVDASSQNLGAFNFRHYGHYQLSSETHGMDDVGIYATGPRSHLFAGAYEQNAIPYLMAYASKIGPYAEASSGKGLKSRSLVAMLAVLLGQVMRIVLL